MLRKQVYISDDTWLETLKFLTLPQWSQKAFVCRQISGIVERNISRLPKLVLDDATMYFTEYHSGIQKQRLMDPDFTFDAPADVTAENVLIGAGKWTCVYKSFHQRTIEMPAEFPANLNFSIRALEEIPRFKIQKIFSTTSPILYREQFNPVSNRIQHSWAHLAQFLELVYHPTSYFREVEMFAVNQKFIDSLKCNVDSVDNKPRYIRCAFFTLKTGDDTNTADLSDSLEWLVRNVRAKNVWICDIDDTAVFPVLANFLFGASGANQCASKEIYFLCRFCVNTAWNFSTF
ncbi:hypothetical protein Ddc_24019 [Ditylenchus destructor]|nr:hypothetical protein Ddc_24019 [Ditylenchus destructor]